MTLLRDLVASSNRQQTEKTLDWAHRFEEVAVREDESAIRQLGESTQDAQGPIALFVSNAGYVTMAGLEDSNDSINNMWDVHCMSHIYAARAVLPSMITSSIASRGMNPCVPSFRSQRFSIFRSENAPDCAL